MRQWEWEYKLEIKSNKVPRMEPLSIFSTLTQWQHNGPKLQHNFYIEFNPVQLRMASKMYTCNFSMNVSISIVRFQSTKTDCSFKLKDKSPSAIKTHEIKW